jgi:predicted HicB family RNase H-like nuclease
MDTDKDTAKRKRLCFWVPLRLHAEAQYLANINDKTLQDFVSEALTEKIEKEGRR